MLVTSLEDSVAIFEGIERSVRLWHMFDTDDIILAPSDGCPGAGWGHHSSAGGQSGPAH